MAKPSMIPSLSLSAPFEEKKASFYLGDLENTEGEKTHFFFNSNQLSTHAVVVGMTGSGKSGLSVSLLEEAALDSIPSIVIDPKGDLANLALRFPNLDPADFAPWVPPGKNPEDEASRVASGLRESHQDKARIQRYMDSASICVYTPGSRIGVPVAMINKLAPPDRTGAAIDDEILHDHVFGIVSSLLALIEVEGDPLKSREHTLLSTIFMKVFQKGETLDLPSLIALISEPNFKKIGVLDLELFYPKKDRFELAVAFNQLLASPGFDVWLEGVPLDIDHFLWTKEKKPKISVFSISHLNDAERMVFVSLLLNQIVAWVRKQPGTSELRALLFMDEIFGYFPPVANPPSKTPLLTLLKQARAFGLGILLATQNPVDLDYKGLSNCGTWFIGRLQTERDKRRILEGLSGALVGLDKHAFDSLLSSLKPRSFLVHSAQEEKPNLAQPKILRSRFTLSYLRGPLTRELMMQLTQSGLTTEVEMPSSLDLQTLAQGDTTNRSHLRDDDQQLIKEPKTSAKPKLNDETDDDFSALAPAAPEGICSLFLTQETPENPAKSNKNRYCFPHLLGSANVSFRDDKLGIEQERVVTALVPFNLKGPILVDWDQSLLIDQKIDEMKTEPEENSRDRKMYYASIPFAATKIKSYSTWKKEFQGWLIDHQKLELLKADLEDGPLYSKPYENEVEFRTRLAPILSEKRRKFLQDLEDSYEPKFAKLKIQSQKAKELLAKEEAEKSDAARGAFIDVGVSILGAIFGRTSAAKVTKGVSAAAKGASRIQKQSREVISASQKLAQIDQMMEELESELREAKGKFEGELDPTHLPLENVVLRPKKTQVQIDLFALAWKEKT